ncbi:MAG: hypothetical protein QXS23_01335 [Desulfurococcaceae archaeon]
MKKHRILYFSILLVEFTSIPLLLLCYIYLLTGYQIINPHLSLFPRASRVHGDEALRLLFLLLVTIHSIAGVLLMCERRVRPRIIRIIIEALVITVLIAIAAFLLTLDLIY